MPVSENLGNKMNEARKRLLDRASEVLGLSQGRLLYLLDIGTITVIMLNAIVRFRQARIKLKEKRGKKTAREPILL